MTEPAVELPGAVRRAALTEARTVRRLLSPPPDLTVSEWADAFRMLSGEASAEPGPWRTSRAPYLRGIMDTFSDPHIEAVVVMSASQIGKTEVILNVIGYFIDQDPSPLLVIQPSEQPMGYAFSKDRLAPMLRDSPRLHGKISPAKSRNAENTILHKKFTGGHITITGANSPSGLAARPIRVVLFDEVDRFKESAGTEGDPVNLGVARTANFWNRKIGLFSTPTVKGFSRIEAAFEEGDRRYYHVPCPHCGERQRLRWAQLKWEDNDPLSAEYECVECEVRIREEEKQAMLQRGSWVAELPERQKTASFHINALYSPWVRWSELVEQFLKSKGNPELLQVFVNTKLGETWEEDAEQISSTSLMHRTEKYTAEVPAGVGALTAAIDVQGDRLEFKVKGWGAGEESWLIAYEQLWGDPSQRMVWNDVDELLSRAYEHESGAKLKILACCVDSGGHHADEVYRFCKPRASQRVFAVKGMPGWGRPILSRPSTNNRLRAKLFTVGTVTAKDVIFARLKLTKSEGDEGPIPGYMHFPDWLDDEYFAQLTAEKAVTKWKRGRPTREYKKTRERNEALDLEVYNLAALALLGLSVRDHLDLHAKRVLERAEEEKEEWRSGGAEDIRRATKRRRNWVEGWRD